jgi:hypothetical protein
VATAPRELWCWDMTFLPAQVLGRWFYLYLIMDHEHKHSAIRYVSPAQRHDGRDQAILAERHAVYLQARQRHPRRWSGASRNWTPTTVVTLNPERDAVVSTGAERSHKQTLVA